MKICVGSRDLNSRDLPINPSKNYTQQGAMETATVRPHCRSKLLPCASKPEACLTSDVWLTIRDYHKSSARKTIVTHMSIMSQSHAHEPMGARL